jgi:hypothetical protein
MQGTTLLLSLLFAVAISRIKKCVIVVVVTAIAAIFIAFFNYYYSDVLSWHLMADRPIMSYCLMQGITLFAMAFYANRKNRLETMKITALLAFTVVPGLGSDIMVKRFIWIYTLPILLTFKPMPRRGVWALLVLTFVASASFLFVKNYRYVRNNIATVDNARIENLLQTPEHKQQIDTLIFDIRENIPNINDATVAGQGKYLVNYLLTDGSGYQNAFFHYIGHDQVEHVNPNMLEDIARHNYVILVAPWYNNVARYAENNAAIKAAGFEELIVRPTYIIYKRSA